MLVISTNKGLCGGLNTNLLKKVREEADENTDFVTVGRKLRTALAKSGETLIADFEIDAFNDADGKWMFNLWYSDVQVGDRVRSFSSKGEVQDFCADHFLLLRQLEDSDDDELEASGDGIPGLGHGTVICHSWRVRLQDGKLELPMPREESLFIYDEQHPT